MTVLGSPDPSPSTFLLWYLPSFLGVKLSISFIGSTIFADYSLCALVITFVFELPFDSVMLFFCNKRPLPDYLAPGGRYFSALIFIC